MENTKRIVAVLFFALFICFGLTTSCKESKNQQSDDSPDSETVKKPEEIIEVDVARVQYKTYEKRRVALIQKYEDSVDGYHNDKIRQNQNSQQTQIDPNDPNGERFDVARYVSWDYDTIKNYLNYIEQEAKLANIEISTLRFYFSNYPENAKSAVHPRQNSIMITPTLHQNDREYIFSINNTEAKNPRPLLLSDSFGPIQNSEKGMGAKLGKEKRSYASLLPDNSLLNNNTLPPPSSSSVTMNKGNGGPPPHHAN